MAHLYQLRQTQATASSTGIQAWETWHRARGSWGMATVARVQATVQTIQRFLLGTCLLVICLFTAEGRGRWVSRTLPGHPSNEEDLSGLTRGPVGALVC